MPASDKLTIIDVYGVEHIYRSGMINVSHYLQLGVVARCGQVLYNKFLDYDSEDVDLCPTCFDL